MTKDEKFYDDLLVSQGRGWRKTLEEIAHKRRWERDGYGQLKNPLPREAANPNSLPSDQEIRDAINGDI